MLGADGQPNRIGLDLLIIQLLLRKLAVGGGRRMDDQAFHIGNVGKERENLQAVNKLMGLLLSAPDFKC